MEIYCLFPLKLYPIAEKNGSKESKARPGGGESGGKGGGGGDHQGLGGGARPQEGQVDQQDKSSRHICPGHRIQVWHSLSKCTRCGTLMDEGSEGDKTSREGGLPTLAGLYHSTIQPSQRGFFRVHMFV